MLVFELNFQGPKSPLAYLYHTLYKKASPVSGADGA